LCRLRQAEREQNFCKRNGFSVALASRIAGHVPLEPVMNFWSN
jgi:hypothetical protein